LLNTSVRDIVKFEFNEFSPEETKPLTRLVDKFVFEDISSDIPLQDVVFSDIYEEKTPEAPLEVPDEPAQEEAPSEESQEMQSAADCTDIIKKYEQEALALKETILDNAAREAAMLKLEEKEAGFKTGYDEGYYQGKTQAIFEHTQELLKEKQLFLEEVKTFVRNMENEKAVIADTYMETLKELAVAVAEKVVNVSLKSSDEVIKKMLAAAVEKSQNKQWAKIYISNLDENLIIEGEKDILDIVGNVSEQVKVVIMENKPAGTCIVEFPDQIIDASVQTQMDNIKQLLSIQ